MQGIRQVHNVDNQATTTEAMMSNKIQWMAWEKYTGRVIAVANSYEALMRRGAAIRAACIGKSDYLPEWAGRNWRKGDTLPMRG